MSTVRLPTLRQSPRPFNYQAALIEQAAELETLRLPKLRQPSGSASGAETARRPAPQKFASEDEELKYFTNRYRDVSVRVGKPTPAETTLSTPKESIPLSTSAPAADAAALAANPNATIREKAMAGNLTALNSLSEEDRMEVLYEMKCQAIHNKYHAAQATAAPPKEEEVQQVDHFKSPAPPSGTRQASSFDRASSAKDDVNSGERSETDYRKKAMQVLDSQLRRHGPRDDDVPPTSTDIPFLPRGAAAPNDKHEHTYRFPPCPESYAHPPKGAVAVELPSPTAAQATIQPTPPEGEAAPGPRKRSKSVKVVESPLSVIVLDFQPGDALKFLFQSAEVKEREDIVKLSAFDLLCECRPDNFLLNFVAMSIHKRWRGLRALGYTRANDLLPFSKYDVSAEVVDQPSPSPSTNSKTYSILFQADKLQPGDGIDLLFRATHMAMKEDAVTLNQLQTLSDARPDLWAIGFCTSSIVKKWEGLAYLGFGHNPGTPATDDGNEPFTWAFDPPEMKALQLPQKGFDSLRALFDVAKEVEEERSSIHSFALLSSCLSSWEAPLLHFVTHIAQKPWEGLAYLGYGAPSAPEAAPRRKSSTGLSVTFVPNEIPETCETGSRSASPPLVRAPTPQLQQ